MQAEVTQDLVPTTHTAADEHQDAQQIAAIMSHYLEMNYSR